MFEREIVPPAKGVPHHSCIWKAASPAGGFREKAEKLTDRAWENCRRGLRSEGGSGAGARGPGEQARECEV